MKKLKNKKFFLVKKILQILFIFTFSIGVVYAKDAIEDYIQTQTSLYKGTNNNIITFSKRKTSYFINKDNNNLLYKDYFKGYYYDNIYGYFKFDWSLNLDDNVHIESNYPEHIGSCNKAWKLAGKAYSKYMGFIDFGYDSSTFVYFCEDDKKLYGNSYSNLLGKQNFDGIKIRIQTDNNTQTIDYKGNYSNSNNIIKENIFDPNEHNFNNPNIGGGDIYEMENFKINQTNENERIFWIIK